MDAAGMKMAGEEPKKKVKVIKEHEFILEAKALFKSFMDCWQDTFDEMVEDLRFINGDQWPQALRAMRESDDRPCLRINKFPQFVDRVQGEMRRARPSIKIRPVDDHGDDDTAEVLTGLCRNIEAQSDAEIVYDSAGEASVQCGFGVWRVVSDYVDNESFDQELTLKRIKNQFSVLFDPAAEDWSKNEGRAVFVYNDIPRDEFRAKWPKSKNPMPWSAEGRKSYGDWATEDTIRVCEFFKKESDRSKLYLIHIQGENKAKTVKELPAEGIVYTVLKEREIEEKKINWYRITGSEILEGPVEIKGGYFPVVPVWGKELNIEGKSYYAGIVRNAKDSMRLYNYFRSMDAETIALAPRAPWLVTSKMIGPYQSMWKQANKRNYSFLVYEPDPNAPGLKPERQFPQLSNQAVIENIMIADQELHDTTGLQLASLGKKSNEKSGKAIEARAKESEVSQFTYVDNQVRAIKHTVKILLAMIPHTYDNARVQRIIGEDGSAKSVKINQPFQENEDDPVERIFDLTTGKYDAVASVGPSYETQRQEGLAAMIEFAGMLDPQQRALIADQIAETSDWHGKDIIAERLRKTLPPGIAEEEDVKPPTQAEMQAQAMAEAAQEAELEMREVELAIKKAERVKAEAEAAIAEAEAAIKEAEASQTAKDFISGRMEKERDENGGKKRDQSNKMRRSDKKE